MTDPRTICDALRGRWHGGHGLPYCPAHENTRTPALSLRDGDDGKLLVNCFAGCDGAAILAALRARGLREGRSDRKPDAREADNWKAEKDRQDLRRAAQARRCWR